MRSPASALGVLIAGAGIGGLATALGLARQGYRVEVMEQSLRIGENGAGIQLRPNAFAAFDVLDGSEVASAPLGEVFRKRFANPYAVIHRADVHA